MFTGNGKEGMYAFELKETSPPRMVKLFNGKEVSRLITGGEPNPEIAPIEDPPVEEPVVEDPPADDTPVEEPVEEDIETTVRILQEEIDFKPS